MAKVAPVYYARANAVFAAHVGAGPVVEGHGATPWRNWLICGIAGSWFAVPKADPTVKPRAYLCSLAQVKANLLAGY